MLITAFLDYLLLEKKYSKHTIAAYKNDLVSFRDFCATTYEEEELSLIAYPVIRNWIVSLVNQGFTNRSINRKISSLRSFYKFLTRTGEILVSPLLRHKALKVAQRVQVPFSLGEITKVLTNFENAPLCFEVLRNKLIVELLYSTGMRRAELIGLQETSINFSEKTIKVLGKRNKERIIPLISLVFQTLEDYLEIKREKFMKSSSLFLTTKGNKIYETLVYRVINNYFSGVSSKTKKSPHILRHSFATHLLNEGADLNSVKELLGHSSLASTQVYVHTSLSSLKKTYNQAHPRSNKNDNL
jgi:integrase/recombinase XerC